MTRESIVLRNAIERPGYSPYCMRCPGLVRMRQVGHMHWRCTCGAEHDERACRSIIDAFAQPPITIDLTIDVLYTCHTCGLRKASAPVPARGTEDVIQWLEKVAMPLVGADHKRRSFLCRSPNLDVMIPVSGAGRVGEASSN
jgi:hypothetical protein